jgi:hypothetical protein
MSWRGETPIVTRAPNQSQGYYVGYGPQNGGSGSGMGVKMAGIGSLAQGQTVSLGGQEWHPTVLYLGALIIAEMFAFGFIGHLLSK